jgi:hypothetical protein
VDAVQATPTNKPLRCIYATQSATTFVLSNTLPIPITQHSPVSASGLATRHKNCYPTIHATTLADRALHFLRRNGGLPECQRPHKWPRERR